MDTHHNRTRREWGGRKLHVQDVNRMAAQLSAQGQWNANDRRVRQGAPHDKVGPPSTETIDGLRTGDEKSIAVDRIDLRERFNQMRRVAFVTCKPGPDRMGVDCDAQVLLLLSWIRVNGAEAKASVVEIGARLDP